MKDLPNVEAIRVGNEVMFTAAPIKPTTAAEARDKFLAWVMCKPEAERDAILYAADKILDAVTTVPHMLNALALANAELAALHEEGNLISRVIVPT